MVKHTLKILKHVWPFFNIMSEKVKSKLSPRSGTKVLKQLTSIHEKGFRRLNKTLPLIIKFNIQGDSEKKHPSGFSQNCKLKVNRRMEIRIFVYYRTSNNIAKFQSQILYPLKVTGILTKGRYFKVNKNMFFDVNFFVQMLHRF